MYQIKAGEETFEIKPTKGNSSSGEINNESYELDLLHQGDEMHVLLNHKSYNLSVVEADYDSKSFTIRVNNNLYTLEAKDRFDLLLEELGMEDLAAGGVNDLKAPMPGLVLSVEVEEGQEVKKGEPLVVLEAMKMENVLKAETDATVKSVAVNTSQAVEKNQVLVEFES